MFMWRINTLRIAFKAAKDRDMVGSASVDYLMYSGYIVMAYFWAQMADAAFTGLKSGKQGKDFTPPKSKPPSSTTTVCCHALALMAKPCSKTHAP